MKAKPAKVSANLARLLRFLRNGVPEVEQDLREIEFLSRFMIDVLGREDQSGVDNIEAAGMVRRIEDTAAKHFPDVAAELRIVRREARALKEKDKPNLREELAKLWIVSAAKRLETENPRAAERLLSAAEKKRQGQPSLAMFICFGAGDTLASDRLKPLVEQVLEKRESEKKSTAKAREAKKGKQIVINREKAIVFARHYLATGKVWPACKAAKAETGVPARTYQSWSKGKDNYKLWMSEVERLRKESP